MCRLRRVKEKNGYLSNSCGLWTESGTPMVGSKYCEKDCKFYRGTIKILNWEFIRCKFNSLLY